MGWGDIAGVVIIVFSIVVFGYFVVLNTTYLVLFSAAFVGAKRYVLKGNTIDLYEVFRSPLTPSISVIMPAYNEAPIIVEAVRSALMLHYPRFEVVVVNDGSADETLGLLKDAYKLRSVTKEVQQKVASQEVRGVYISVEHDNLVVVDKVNGGKADALNAGINVSRHDLICVVDADSLIEPDALLKIARPFIETPDLTVAAGGVVRIVNGCEVSSSAVAKVSLPRNYWANMQIVEYLRAFLGGRLGWSAIRCPVIISGAFGGFKRRELIEIGGYRRDTVGEDMDLVIRLHRHLREIGRDYRMYFIPDPVCWTQAPVSYSQLSLQRDRWQRGLIESFAENNDMLFNPRYGVIGMFAMPFYLFFEMFGPLVELFGYVMVVLALVLGQLDARFLYLFLSVAILYGIIVSLTAVFLEGISFRRYPRLGSLIRLSFYALVENVGYRQINTWWRAKAYLTYFTRKKSWGEMDRTGFEEKENAGFAETLQAQSEVEG